MVRRNIVLINIYMACTNMVFFLPVIIPYYHSIGLTFADFLIGEAFFSAAVLLAEVPSGWMSDTWKRRGTMIAGLLFGICGYAGLMSSETLLHTVLAQATIGIAVALNSGTVAAILYDTLLSEGREAEYRKEQGRSHAISLYSVGFASVAGAFAFTIDPKLPLMLSMSVLALNMLMTMCIIEPERVQKAPETHMLRDIAETARFALRGHPEIAGIIMVSMVAFCATKLMLWAQQPYYMMLDFPVEWFGVILAGGYVVGGVAGQWSHRIDHIGSNRGKLAFMLCALVIACALLWAFPSAWICVPLFLVGTLVWAVGNPVVQNAINLRVGSERRATILSTASLMVHVLFIPTSIMLAMIETASDIRTSLLALAIQITVLGSAGLWLWKKGGAKEQVPA